MAFKLPAKGERVPLQKIKQICDHFELTDLWQKIARDPPARPFASDGCSMWVDAWPGKKPGFV